MSTGTKLTDEFRTSEIVVRGTTYKLRELSAAEYDDILKLATGADESADLSAVLKLMALKSIVEPKITAEELAAKPYTVYAKLLGAVNRLHFSADEDEEPTPNS